MTEKTKISISEIEQLTARLREINMNDLNDIDFMDDDGNVINIDQNIREDFRFTGLNVCDFITTNFYKKGFDN